MIVELVWIQTTDGVRLDGAVSRCHGQQAPGIIICLHGVGSNFYSGSMMQQLAKGLVNPDWDVLRVNTRGHDHAYVGAYKMGVRRFGAGYEMVEDCLVDIAGWLTWADKAGYAKIILLGHSLGALKTVYHQAHADEDRVTAVLAISPPQLSYRAFQTGDRAEDFRVSFDAAETLIASGNPQALIDVTVPAPLVITAACYVEKYGPDEKYNLIEFIDRLKVPAHFIYGGGELVEGGAAFEGLDEIILAQVEGSDAADLITLEVIPEANHMYTRHTDQLLNQLQYALKRW